MFWNAGIRRSVRVDARSVLSACGIGAAGSGVTLLDELMARDYAHLAIEMRPLDEAIDQAFSFAVPEGPPPSRTTEIFIATAAGHLRSPVTGHSEGAS